MTARLVAVLALSAAATLASCHGGGGSATETPARAMARLPEPTKNQVSAYLGAVAGLVSVLAGITDSPSASAAMPTLTEYIAKVSDHAREIDAADPETRRRISDAYGSQFTSQNDAFAAQVNRIKGTPGLGTKLGPLLDKIELLR